MRIDHSYTHALWKIDFKNPKKKYSCTTVHELLVNPGTLLLSLACLFDVNSSDCVVGAQQMKLHCLEAELLSLLIS